jgi:hypothetical protein
MQKKSDLNKLSYESDGKMGKEQYTKEIKDKQSIVKDFFNTTPNSE